MAAPVLHIYDVAKRGDLEVFFHVDGQGVYKLARCTLFEAATFAGEDGADEHYLAWANSLRLDLQALGLQRRERQVMDLKTYIDESGGKN